MHALVVKPLRLCLGGRKHRAALIIAHAFEMTGDADADIALCGLVALSGSGNERFLSASFSHALLADAETAYSSIFSSVSISRPAQQSRDCAARDRHRRAPRGSARATAPAPIPSNVSRHVRDGWISASANRPASSAKSSEVRSSSASGLKEAEGMPLTPNGSSTCTS